MQRMDMDSEIAEKKEAVEQLKADKKADSADQRSFWTMVVLVAQNAFNDKAAQTMLIALGVFLANVAYKLKYGAEMSADLLAIESANASAWISPAFAILILVPFIFLAPVAGWVADRYSKTRVLRASAMFQMLVLGFIFWSVTVENFNIAIVGFGLLALQSALMSPAKKGIVKEMVGSERLGFASGILELSSVLAICVGQILSGFWFNSRIADVDSPWIAVHWPLLLLFICSIPAFLATFSIKLYPSPAKRPFQRNILWEHVGQMRDVLGDSNLRLSALAIAFFWFVGGFINIVAIQVANQLTSGTSQGMGVELAYLLTSASGGMIFGGVVASLSCRRSIELGLVPIGGILMGVGCIALACVDISGVWFKLWIAFTGFGASIFLVPLNAYLQDACPEEKRGKVIAGSNLLDCVAGAIAVGLFMGLTAIAVPISVQFIILATLCMAVTIYASKILPQHFVRFTLLTVLRVFYRQKVLNVSRIPKEGGVLIVPNHVTYIDAFILTAASTRPIRFLVADEYYQRGGLIRLFLQTFDVVPISSRKAKEAIQVAADAVLEGAVVCIFPEGQLSRTGCMNEMKRGFEMIARKVKCPVVPVYMDGLWGSIFSYERGKFLKKWPYRLQYGVTVNWGEPFSPREATAVKIREELTQLGMEAFRERGQLATPSKTLRSRKVSLLEGDAHQWRRLQESALSLSEDKLYQLVYNALQLTETHAICRNDVVAVRVDELADASLVLAVAFPLLGNLSLVLVSEKTSKNELRQWHDRYGIQSYIGGDKLEAQLKQAGIADTELYLVNGDSAVAQGRYPLVTSNGVVVALSMPHPEATTATNQFQAGWKENSYGRVLSGFVVTHKADSDEVDIAIPKSKDPLMTVNVDAEGFIMKH